MEFSSSDAAINNYFFIPFMRCFVSEDNSKLKIKKLGNSEVYGNFGGIGYQDGKRVRNSERNEVLNEPIDLMDTMFCVHDLNVNCAQSYVDLIIANYIVIRQFTRLLSSEYIIFVLLSHVIAIIGSVVVAILIFTNIVYCTDEVVLEKQIQLSRLYTAKIESELQSLGV